MDDLSKLFSQIDVSKGHPYRVKAPPSPRAKRNNKESSKKVGFLLFHKTGKNITSRIVYQIGLLRYYIHNRERHYIPPFPRQSNYFSFNPSQKASEKKAKARITREKNKILKKITAQQGRLKKEAEKKKVRAQSEYRKRRRQYRDQVKIKEEISKKKGYQAEAEMGDLTAMMGRKFFFGRKPRKSSRRRRKSRKSRRKSRKSSRRRKSRRKSRKSSRRRKSRRKSRKSRKSRRKSRKSSRRRKSRRKSRKSSSCKRRRVRLNKDGKFNKKDMDHNTKCYNKNFLKDNPWMLEPWALKQVPHPAKK